MRPSFFFQLFTFPMYILCLIYFFKSFDFIWLLNIGLLFVIYETIWWTSSHALSLIQIKDFYDEFVGPKRNFDINPIPKDKLDFDFKEDFGWLVFNYEDFRKKRLNTNNIVLQVPLLFMYAMPLKNKIMTGSKAYVYGPHTYLMVCRTKNIDANFFEKFLFYHELHHISDSGLFFFRSLARHRLRLFFHALMTAPLLLHPLFIPAYIIFVFLCGSTLYVKSISMGETMADIGGLLSMASNAERAKALHLLQKNITSQFNKGGFWNKRINALRYRQLQMMVNTAITDILDLDDEDRKYYKSLLKSYKFFGVEPETLLSTLIFIITASFFYIKAVVFLYSLCAFYFLYLLFFKIFMRWGSKITSKVINYVCNRFKTEELFTPFLP